MRHWVAITSTASRLEAEEKIKKLKAEGREVKLGYCWIHHGRRAIPRKSRGFSILELLSKEDVRKRYEDQLAKFLE